MYPYLNSIHDSHEYNCYHGNTPTTLFLTSRMEETEDNKKLYELQEYDNDGGFPEPYQGEVKIQETSTGGRIQFVIMIIQLVLLVVLLCATIAVLYQVYTNSTPDVSNSGLTSSENNCDNTTAKIVIDRISNLLQLSNAGINQKLNESISLSQLSLSTGMSLQRNNSEQLGSFMETLGRIEEGIVANAADQREFNANHSDFVDRVFNTTSSTLSKLTNIVNTLSNLQDTSTSTAGVVDDILLIAQELLVLHNDSTALPTSCKDLQEQQPNSPSGYYILAGPTGTYSTYCNMGTLCGSGGGWTRLAYLDMSDATQNCPSGFRLYQSGGVKACGRPATSSGSCVSVQFPSNGISYSQICGRVTGYQYGTTDAVSESVHNINSYYVDGVSITRGSPRQHVWTLYAGVYSDYSMSTNICPCAGGTSPQSFVGNNYFCEAGTPGTHVTQILYTSDPLWDGQGCSGLESPCCNVPGIPWFHRDYGSITTTDYIELRVCGDEGSANNDDAPVSHYEIYIK